MVHVQLFQSASKKSLLALQGIDNPKYDACSYLACFARLTASLKEADPDPTLFCTAYKKNRFYLFTTREPEETGGDVGRDVFNEKPTREEQLTATG